MRSQALAALLCLLAACAGSDPTEPSSDAAALTACEPLGRSTQILLKEQRCATWRIQDSFAAEQSAAFFSAAARWNAFLGFERFVISVDGECPIIKRDLTAEDAVSFFRYDDSSLGIDLVRFARDFPEQNREHFEVLVMHEMGHAMGMRHVPAGIMGAGKEHATIDFSADDRSECACLNLCK